MSWTRGSIQCLGFQSQRRPSTVKITSISTFPVALELRHPFRIAGASFTHMRYVMIAVATDDGLTGYGESAPAWDVTGETQCSVMECIDYLTEPDKTGFSLVGQELATLQDVRNIMAVLSPEDRPGIFWGAPAAKAGLEEALLDLAGKIAGKPVYELFGGRPRTVPYAPVLGIAPVGATLEHARELLDNGFEKIKVKVGVASCDGLENYQRDVDVVVGVRELIAKINPRARLVADANQGFITASKTIEFAKKTAGCLDYLEQPVLAGDLLGFKQIKEACDVPLMADESLHSHYDAQVLIELKAVDWFNVKLMKCGGMIGALKIAELARAHDIEVVIGSMLENQVGAIPSLHTYFCDDIFSSTESGFFSYLKANIGSGLSVDDGIINTPSGPGIGLDVDERDFRKHLIAPEGSKTIQRILSLFGGTHG